MGYLGNIGVDVWLGIVWFIWLIVLEDMFWVELCYVFDYSVFLEEIMM